MAAVTAAVVGAVVAGAALTQSIEQSKQQGRLAGQAKNRATAAAATAEAERVKQEGIDAEDRRVKLARDNQRRRVQNAQGGMSVAGGVDVNGDPVQGDGTLIGV